MTIAMPMFPPPLAASKIHAQVPRRKSAQIGASANLRTLPVFGALPKGCAVHVVSDDGAEPVLHCGDIAVIDSTDREPKPERLFAIRYNSPTRPEGYRELIIELRTCEHEGPDGPFVGWWAGRPDRPRSAEELDTAILARRDMHIAEGPMSIEGVRGKLVGAVIGVLDRASPDAPSRPGGALLRDPGMLPRRYAMTVQGRCLEPHIADGAMLAFDGLAEIKPGQLVVIWRRPEYVRPGEHQALVKRLMSPPPMVKFPFHPDSEVMPVLFASYLNPPGRVAVPYDEILAVHACLGTAAESARRAQSIASASAPAVLIAPQARSYGAFPDGAPRHPRDPRCPAADTPLNVPETRSAATLSFDPPRGRSLTRRTIMNALFGSVAAAADVPAVIVLPISGRIDDATGRDRELLDLGARCEPLFARYYDDDDNDHLDGEVDDSLRRIMALPAHSLAGLAAKARAASFACCHFWDAEQTSDADWDHMHVRSLIEHILAEAGQALPVWLEKRREKVQEARLAEKAERDAELLALEEKFAPLYEKWWRHRCARLLRNQDFEDALFQKTGIRYEEALKRNGGRHMQHDTTDDYWRARYDAIHEEWDEEEDLDFFSQLAPLADHILKLEGMTRDVLGLQARAFLCLSEGVRDGDSCDEELVDLFARRVCAYLGVPFPPDTADEVRQQPSDVSELLSA